jgi:hypothetical protein
MRKQVKSWQLTDKDTDDASQLPELVEQVQQTGVKVSKVGTDGSYDTFDTYEYLSADGAHYSTPHECRLVGRPA